MSSCFFTKGIKPYPKPQLRLFVPRKYLLQNSQFFSPLLRASSLYFSPTTSSQTEAFQQTPPCTASSSQPYPAHTLLQAPGSTHRAGGKGKRTMLQTFLPNSAVPQPAQAWLPAVAASADGWDHPAASNAQPGPTAAC